MSDTEERANTTGPEAAPPADRAGAPGPGAAPHAEHAPTSDPYPASEPDGVPAPAPAPDDAAAPPTPSAPGGAPAPVAENYPVPTVRTRFGGLWIVLISGTVVLVLLLVFILQNSQRVEVHIYGGHWNAPLGVALLMASALGVLLVVVPGTGRIIQLRRAALRAHRRATKLARTQSAPQGQSADRPQA
jgi:uncharacterized integral membrane protein